MLYSQSVFCHNEFNAVIAMPIAVSINDSFHVPFKIIDAYRVYEQCKHGVAVIGGNTCTASLMMGSDPDKNCAVEFRNVRVDLKDAFIINHLESPRNNGGQIDCLHRDVEHHAVYVSFKDPNGKGNIYENSSASNSKNQHCTLHNQLNFTYSF